MAVENPQPPQLVHRMRPRAPAVRVVRILAAREAEFVARLQPRLVHAGQFIPPIAPDADRPRVAVVRAIAEVEVPFEPLERRENVLPGPFRVAFSRPTVVILGHASQRDGRVHRARPARHASARERPRSARFGRLVAEAPVVGRVRVVVAVYEVVGRLPGIGIIRPCLDEQHRPPRILARPGRDHRTRRARADNHDVEEFRVPEPDTSSALSYHLVRARRRLRYSRDRGIL